MRRRAVTIGAELPPKKTAEDYAELAELARKALRRKRILYWSVVATGVLLTALVVWLMLR